MNKYMPSCKYMYNFISVFLYVLCNENTLLIMGSKYLKNVIYNLG
jgi:hypothetical protein